MDDSARKIKSYIEEISLVHEKNPFDLKGFLSCAKKYNFSDYDDLKLEQISLSHHRRSEELLRKGKLTEAITSMERAVEISPLSASSRNKLAQLYLMKAAKDGFKKNGRDMAFLTASFSLKLNKTDPIARSILKEIKSKDKKISRKARGGKLIFPMTALILIIIAALFLDNDFEIPLLSAVPSENKTDNYETAPQPVIQTFTEREIETQVTNFNDELEISLNKSLLSKTNGSFSYLLQAELRAPEVSLKSADLNIDFITPEGDSLFKKSFPLIDENWVVSPGETVLIDEFFYIHYLPPEINRVNINLKNISFHDKIIIPRNPEDLDIEWNSFRPEGVKISMILEDSSDLKGYSGFYKSMKIKLINQGNIPIHNMEIALAWKDEYGNLLHKKNDSLISENNPPLVDGGDRVFHLFSEVPVETGGGDSEFYIEINRIN